MKRIYLDYAATTPLRRSVARAIRSAERCFGNPSSPYSEGGEARKVLESARTSVAHELSCKKEEIVFTSGGTESNNLALQGILHHYLSNGRRLSDLHVIMSDIESASVREVCAYFAKLGLAVSEVSAGERGIVSPESVVAALRPETVLVSMMYVNNEIGTIQPIGKIARAVHSARPDVLVHTDAAQAPLFLPVVAHTLGVDLMSLDAQKLYGPRGAGALFVKRGTPLMPLLIGGGQEQGMRSGTENVPAIAGFAEALTCAGAERARESERLTLLRDRLFDALLALDPRIIANGDRVERLPNNINISLPWIDTEFLVLQLDAHGFSVASKSACHSGEGASHVVAALGGAEGHSRAQSSLRITLGRATRARHLSRFTHTLAQLIREK